MQLLQPSNKDVTFPLVCFSVSQQDNHGRRKRGVCRGSDTPNYLCGGDIDNYVYPP